ncbi:MAG: MBL fold metallo-hydrolase [Desulfobacteraceae bacterium]
MEPGKTKESFFIKFLGTAGARFVVARQLRYSAGTFISAHSQQLMLDPGPGTLVRCARAKPGIDVTKLDAIILTHAHLDHSNDVNILIDALTQGGLKKRGLLFAPQECLRGKNAVVLEYVKDFLEEIVTLKPAQNYQIGNLKFATSIRHDHEVETYGMQFDLDGQRLAFMVDTKYFPELIDSYRNTDILVLNVVRYKPHKSGKVKHLCIDDVKEIVSNLKPQKAILTHFGMTMLKAKPWEVAQKLSAELGIEVIAASDGMRLDLESRN